MPRVELAELHEGRDTKTQIFKVVNTLLRRFNLVGQLSSAIESAATLILPGDGDYTHVVGSTAIDFVAIRSLGDGDPVEMYFDDGLTLHHATAGAPSGAYALQLAGAVNAVMAAGSKMRLRRDDSLGVMVEMWRGAP